MNKKGPPAMPDRKDAPNLSMKHMRAVVALARFGSFVAAASYLRMSQPGLSRIIQQTEAMLGVKLFARGTRRVSQTEAGRGFIPAAERLLGELLQEAQKARTLDGELRGQLIISSLMSISHHLLPAALVVFRKKHPKMHVQIREGLTSAVHEDVRSGIADFGIGHAIGLTEGVLAESVVHEACFVVMPKRHRLNSGQSISVKDIGDEPMVSMPTDSGLRRTIDVVASERGVVFNHSIIINQFGSLFDFVAHGLGISIVPASALPPMTDPSIAVRPLRPAVIRRIGILRLAERSLLPASQAFLDIFKPRFFAATRNQQQRSRAATR
jgi:LysR family transcriptional regulator, carnitine catabolism transcriptional activator